MEVDNQVRVEIHNCHNIGFVTLEELIGHLQEALDLAPDEHKHNVEIDLWSEGERELDIQVAYTRDRTPEELRNAFDRNAEAATIAREKIEIAETTSLMALIKKHPKLAEDFVKEVSGE